MRMISGSKFISSKDGKNPKTKGDVHVKLGQTFVIAHGSCQFVTDLVNNCFHIANKIKGFINPIDLLNHAYLETKVPGSSTACIITLNEWCLHAVNIGDNGFIHLRNEEILYESPIQQHTYKTPYQLGKANDSPEEIKLTELEPGDIIIAGSAGLFNNLFTHEIKDLVINEIRKDPAPSPDMIAAEIAKNATERSIDKCRFTPYSKAAWQAGKRHKGGPLCIYHNRFHFRHERKRRRIYACHSLDDELDYHDSRRHRRRFEDDLEMDTRAENRIFNVKKGHKDIPRKSSLSAIKSSRRPVDFSDSEREESEYERDGEEDERSFSRKRAEEPEEEYAEEEEEEDEHDEEEAEANEESEEEVEEPKQKGKEYAKRKGIESDEDSPPRKTASHRRMAFVYESDEE